MKKIFFTVTILIITLGCQESQKKRNSTENEVVIDTTTEMTVDTGGAYPEIEANPTNLWDYSEDEDKMTGVKTQYAMLLSDNTINLGFPYQGGSKSYLTIRRKRGKLDVFISVTPSQMTFDYDNEAVKVRFDKGPLKSYSINKAADGSSDMFFFSNEKAILKNLKSSKKTLVEVVFYDHGSEILEFSTKDLKFN